MEDGSRILVTGGAGFIGSHLVDRLVSEGKQLTVIDNLQGGKMENLSKSIRRVRFLKADIRNRGMMRKAIRECNPDIVFHLAANASVPDSVRNPRYDFEVNVIGTFNLLHALIRHKVDKFVFASSAAIYGESTRPLKEYYRPNPVSPYGATKLCAETLGLSFKRTYGIPFVIARIFNIYGPRLPRYVMYDFCRRLMENSKMLQVMGDGDQTRQFCYVSDAVDALTLLASSGESIYNVAGAEAVSIAELAGIIVSQIAPEAKISYTGESWHGDIKNLVADISRLRRLGFEPKISLCKGIEALIKWFRKSLLFCAREV